MTNHEIAQRFQQIADTLEIQGENPFKVRAYRRAVEAIEELVEPLVEIERRGELDEIPGFGAKTAKNLWQALGVTSIDELEAAAKEGKVQAAPGFGASKEKSILEAI